MKIFGAIGFRKSDFTGKKTINGIIWSVYRHNYWSVRQGLMKSLKQEMGTKNKDVYIKQRIRSGKLTKEDLVGLSNKALYSQFKEKMNILIREKINSLMYENKDMTDKMYRDALKSLNKNKSLRNTIVAESLGDLGKSRVFITQEQQGLENLFSNMSKEVKKAINKKLGKSGDKIDYDLFYYDRKRKMVLPKVFNEKKMEWEEKPDDVNWGLKWRKQGDTYEEDDIGSYLVQGRKFRQWSGGQQ